MGTGRIPYMLFALSGCATTQTTPAPQTDRIVVADGEWSRERIEGYVGSLGGS